MKYPGKGYNVRKQKSIDNLGLTLKQSYELIDTVMFIPVSINTQIHVSIIRKLNDDLLYVDIRNYKLIKDNWKPSNGIEIPITQLNQLVIRLNALNKKLQNGKYKL